MLDLFARHYVLAMVTGHLYKNDEWIERGIRVINTESTLETSYSDGYTRQSARL